MHEFTLVQRIVCIRFEEKVLQSNHHRIKVKHGFPVFSKDVQTNVTLEVDIWMVDLMRNESRSACSHGNMTRTFGMHLTFGGSCG